MLYSALYSGTYGDTYGDTYGGTYGDIILEIQHSRNDALLRRSEFVHRHS